MKIKLKDLPVGSCFSSRRGKVAKKIGEERCATTDAKGRIRRGKCPSPEREVTSAPCTLGLLGAALSGSGKVVVEIGSPFAWEKKRKGAKR